MPTDHPLRLARGSHQAGSGRGCAMNVISWEQGDAIITDYPTSVDRVAARLVQSINDSLCRHDPHYTNGDLCPECSVTVLDLAHAVVGTAGHWSLVDWAQYLARQILAMNAGCIHGTPRMILEALAQRRMPRDRHTHGMHLFPGGTISASDAAVAMLQVVSGDQASLIPALFHVTSPLSPQGRISWLRQWLKDANFTAAPVDDGVMCTAIEAMGKKYPDTEKRGKYSTTIQYFGAVASASHTFPNYWNPSSVCLPSGWATHITYADFQNWAAKYDLPKFALHVA